MAKYIMKNFLIIIIIFLSDRVSKFYVVSKNEEYLSPNLFMSKYLNISLVWNKGIAFGLLSFDHKYFYNFLTMLIIIIATIIFIMIWKHEGFKRYSLLMIFGGALGNLYDRIFFKAVPDFIDFHVGDFHWFIFNIADIFITLGVICLIYDELFLIKKNKV